MTIAANVLMSLAIDQFGWFGLPVHTLNSGRIIGAALMVCGIVLLSKY
jgi:bacterial/archaeal transporter family-2 protein